jgi:hypothetical protein
MPDWSLSGGAGGHRSTALWSGTKSCAAAIWAVIAIAIPNIVARMLILAAVCWPGMAGRSQLESQKSSRYERLPERAGTRPIASSFAKEVHISDGFAIACAILGAVLGGIAGSFINCARYRLPRGISLNRPPYSYCASCGERLTAIDLVPILSWLWLGGRCRRCHARIGVDSLLVEAFCTAIGALIFWEIGGIR